MEQQVPGLTEALLTAAIEASANGIVITDRSGLIQWVNPAFTAMTGYPPATVIGQYPRVLKSGRHDDEFYRSLWTTILEGHPWHGQMVNRRRDGSEYVEEMTITPVRDTAGEITHFIAIKQDISRRVQAEQQLRKAQKMEAVGLLAGGVAHDFNNLLTVINGYSDLILNPEEPVGSHGDYARLIREAGDRGAALVRQLLTFSRGQVIEAVVLQVNTLISEMERMFQRLLPENIQFTSLLEPALAPVLADPGQIQQVLMNLVVNARDAMPEGGRLDVKTANHHVGVAYQEQHLLVPAGSYVLLSVSDTGIGMDETTQEHLFEPFFTTKPLGVGTGLGLSTVYGIVKQSGGWVRVHSEKNKGTSVEVYLPVAEGHTAAAPIERPAAMQVGTETVLLVEDNIEVRRFAAAVLERVGFAVLTAGSGPEAVTVAANHSGPIDLLLTDVILPGANGREVAERLKADRPGLAVLFMSGYTQNVIATDGVIEQGVDYLQKPFNAATLCARVREALQKHNQATRILLVDDDAAILGLLKQMLENSGYAVETASNGKFAMIAFERQPADVVICDLVMPEREGLETIRRLREVDPAVRIVAMSGYFGGQFLHTARLLGADATLLKPVSGPELVRLLRQVLWERRR